MKNALIVILTLFCIVLLYFAHQNKPNNRNSIVYRTDTVIKVIPQKEIKLIETKPKVKYIRDTIIQTPPFIAIIDTIIRRDTVFASYRFPENTMSINLRSTEDTIKISQIVMEPQHTERNWFEIGAAITGGLILGLIIGK